MAVTAVLMMSANIKYASGQSLVFGIVFDAGGVTLLCGGIHGVIPRLVKSLRASHRRYAPANVFKCTRSASRRNGAISSIT